jgi:hypothetical protein
VWRYAGSLDVRCVRTRVCNPAAVKAAEELHARSKGYLTSVRARKVYAKQKAMNEVDAGRDRATPASVRHDDEHLTPTIRAKRRSLKRQRSFFHGVFPVWFCHRSLRRRLMRPAIVPPSLSSTWSLWHLRRPPPPPPPSLFLSLSLGGSWSVCPSLLCFIERPTA